MHFYQPLLIFRMGRQMVIRLSDLVHDPECLARDAEVPMRSHQLLHPPPPTRLIRLVHRRQEETSRWIEHGARASLEKSARRHISRPRTTALEQADRDV